MAYFKTIRRKYQKTLVKKRKHRKYKTKYKFTKARGKVDAVSCLIHGTSLQMFAKILRSGHIQAQAGDPPRKIKEFIETLNKGAFFQLILKCDEGLPIDTLCMNDVILVFSKNLLNEYPYHISTNWVGGMIFHPLIPGKLSSIVKSYDNVDHYISDNIDTLCNRHHVRNEVVFNDHIPINYLSEIWICNTHSMIQRINTKNPDGTYKRIDNTIAFDPEQVKIMADRILTKYNIHVPVKILNNITEINDDDSELKSEIVDILNIIPDKKI